MEKYILDDNNQVKKVDSLIEWATWYEKEENRILKHDRINNILVSTVFLGLDHNHTHKGDPVLFETAIIDNSENVQTARFTSYDEAMKGHEKARQEVLNKHNQG